MDNILDKLSLYDFFIVLATGAVFNIGLELLGIPLFSTIALFINIKDHEAVYNIIFFSVVLVICYLIGCIIQESSFSLQGKIFKIQDNAIETLLIDPNVVKNEIKRKIYIKEAKKLFLDKKLDFDEKSITREQCKYFYAHCLYYIQIRGLSNKTEKLRALHGVANMLSTSFAVLSVIGIIIVIFTLLDTSSNSSIIKLMILIFSYGMLSILFWFKMKNTYLYRIRMVMGIYEVAIDQER